MIFVGNETLRDDQPESEDKAETHILASIALSLARLGLVSVCGVSTKQSVSAQHLA